MPAMKNQRELRTCSRPPIRTIMVLLLPAIGSFAAPGPCGKSSDYNGYKILQVDIKNPIGFITPWSSLSKSLKKGLKLRAGDPFSAESFDQDSTYLNTILKGEFASSQQRLKLAYAGADILACDPDARTLRVVYPIFTTVVASLIPPSIEEQTSESHHPATTGATRASDSGVHVTPMAGYNQTRGTFGGLNFSDTQGPLQVKGSSEDSGNTHNGRLDLGSQVGPVRRLWNHADWAMTFIYLDTPAGAAHFKEGMLTGRLSASTKEVTKQHIIFRYGTAFEGGHQQANDTAGGGDLTPNSGYGSLKLYAGATGRPGNGAFTASYGLQLGSTLTNGVPIFKKHLLDLGYNHTFPVPPRRPLGDSEDFKSPLRPGVHRSLSLETRFTAGLIQDASGTPLAERFLGGNEVRPFVQDDSWIILSDPFIRSIPENRLGALSSTRLGGSRFYSGNATVSFAAWGKPMLPDELTTPGTGFPEVLNPGFHTAATSMANTYKVHDPEYIRLTAEVPAKAGELSRKLAALSNTLKGIPPAIAAQPAVAAVLKNIRKNLIDTRGAASLLATGPDPQVMGRLATQLIPALSGFIQDLSRSLRDAAQNELASQLDALMSDIKALGRDIDAANNLPSKEYEDQAWKKLAPGHRAIDVFLHQLNIYSIAPVAIFDVARVWPVNEGVRYGVGPGLRLSLVNANFTMGYAFNPQRTGTEKTGAIFFKLDVTSLF